MLKMNDPMITDLNIAQLKSIKNLSITSVIAEFDLYSPAKNNSIKDMLAAYRKKSLLDLAYYNFIDLKKSWTKSKMVDTLTEHFTETLTGRLLALDGEQLDLLKQFVESDPAIRNEQSRVHQLFFIRMFPAAVKLGLLFPNQKDNKLGIEMPEELPEALNDFNNSENDELNYFIRDLDLALKAGIHLYGILSYSKIVDLYRILHPEMDLSNASLSKIFYYTSTLAIAHSYFQPTVMTIASDRFDSEFHAEMFMEALNHDHKEDYKPSKDELLFYAKHTFDRRSAEYKQLSKILRKITDDYDIAISIIETHLLLGSRMSILMEELSEDDTVVFNSEKEVGKFVQSYIDLQKKIRLWRNAGNTFQDLKKATPYSVLNPHNEQTMLDETPLPSNVIPFSARANKPNKTIQATSKKIGRNEPCPCGSGLKYKKCCGR